METIDRKFIFTAVNPVNGHFYTEQDAIVFCAKDAAVLGMLVEYRNQCIGLGANAEHIVSVELLIERVQEFQAKVEKRVPDTVGKEITRCVEGLGLMSRG